MTPSQRVIFDLLAACKTLVGEVTGKSATDWGIVNSAMVAGERALTATGDRLYRCPCGYVVIVTVHERDAVRCPTCKLYTAVRVRP